MKILKIFGIVVGIHVFALILIFANPGCSSTRKPAPAPGDTATRPEPVPLVGGPSAASAPSSIYSSTTDSSSAPPITINPDAPALSLPVGITGGARTAPTRPGTPVAGILAAEPVAEVTPASTYTVKSGDNLWTIARKHNLTIAQLNAANGLAPNAPLKPGQKLIIPSKPSTPPSSGSTPAAKPADPLAAAAANAGRSSTDSVKHVVKSGETLGAIARRYGVSQGDLAVANNIADPAKIRPGLELVIPGWKSPGTKSAKSPTKSGSSSATKSAPAPAPATTPAPTPAAPVIDSSPLTPAPAAPSPAPVPVIRIDETPAPKQP